MLEVLQILEGEVNLREETRVAEQARPALKADEHKTGRQAVPIAERARGSRREGDASGSASCPTPRTSSAKEIALLGRFDGHGRSGGDPGPARDRQPAIGAETEAIELLLQSKRINPKAGGGGGADPRRRRHRHDHDSALALLGGGVNDKEVREDQGVSQTTGESGPALPEEFRAGLDEYFNRLEKGTGGQ